MTNSAWLKIDQPVMSLIRASQFWWLTRIQIGVLSAMSILLSAWSKISASTWQRRPTMATTGLWKALEVVFWPTRGRWSVNLTRLVGLPMTFSSTTRASKALQTSSLPKGPNQQDQQVAALSFTQSKPQLTRLLSRLRKIANTGIQLSVSTTSVCRLTTLSPLFSVLQKRSHPIRLRLVLTLSTISSCTKILPSSLTSQNRHSHLSQP